METAKKIDVPGQHIAFVLLWTTGYFLSAAETWRHWDIGLIGIALMACAFSSFAFERAEKPHYSFFINLGIFLFISLNLLWQWPRIANHHVYMFVVSTVAFYSLTKSYFSGRPSDFYRSALFCLAAVYFIAGFHKINIEYLAAGTSCSRMIMENWWSGFHNLIANPFWDFSNKFWKISEHPYFPIFTVVFEIECAVLIFFRQTRFLGIIFALALHAFLAPVGFVDFATIGLASLVTVLKPSRRLINAACIYAAAQLIVGIANYGLRTTSLNDLAYTMQGLLFLAFGAYLIGSIASEVSRASGFAPTHESGRKLYYAPLFVLALGLSNYLGLGTANSFSMFSNLRTEGIAWNHLLMPKEIRLFHYQDEIFFASELDTESGVLVSKDMPMVGIGMNRLELERVFDLWDENKKWPAYFKVSRFQSGPDGIFDIIKEPSFKERQYNYWEKKFLYFRPVQDFGEINLCRW